MKFNNKIALVCTFSSVLILSACLSTAQDDSCNFQFCADGLTNDSSDLGSPPTTPNSTSIPTVANGNNVMLLTVNGSTCGAGANDYLNKPCVTVTICSSSGSGNCVTLDNILIDSGSFGLRVFTSAFANYSNGSNVLAAIQGHTESAGTNKIYAECAQFGDGSADWGSVVTAYLTLGGEQTASAVPMQLIDVNFGASGSTSAWNNVCESSGLPTSPSPDSSPSEAGFNGILGVGQYVADCGTECTTNASNGSYFSCDTTTQPYTCTGSTIPTASQVSNPVGLLPTDHTGVIFELPAIPLAGAVSVTGAVVLGISTQTGSNSGFVNNTPGQGTAGVDQLPSVTSYPAQDTSGASSGDFGVFNTIYNSQTYNQSFIDSGSNGLYFANTTGITPCNNYDGDSNDIFFCNASTQFLPAATVQGFSGLPSNTVNFAITGLQNLPASNWVFSGYGGDAGDSTSTFDWGLPFFIGRNVYVGINAKSGGTLGTGPYWAF